MMKFSSTSDQKLANSSTQNPLIDSFPTRWRATVIESREELTGVGTHSQSEWASSMGGEEMHVPFLLRLS